MRWKLKLAVLQAHKIRRNPDTPGPHRRVPVGKGIHAISHRRFGDEPTAKKYAIKTMPDTFLIDRQGRIAATYVGLVDKDNVEANIRNMLSQP